MAAENKNKNKTAKSKKSKKTNHTDQYLEEFDSFLSQYNENCPDINLIKEDICSEIIKSRNCKNMETTTSTNVILKDFFSLVANLVNENITYKKKIESLEDTMTTLMHKIDNNNKLIINNIDALHLNSNKDPVLTNNNNVNNNNLNNNSYSNNKSKLMTNFNLNVVNNEKDKDCMNQLNDLNKNYAVHKWKENTTLICGDSILLGVDERKMSRSGKIKVRNFPGAKVEDMFFFLHYSIIKEMPIKSYIAHWD